MKETVVVALGTNTTDNYQELLDQLVKDFPKGRRLIFVTPYDGNFTPSESISYQTGQYEKELAEKYDYISIADWYQVAKDNPPIWYNTDLVHFNLESNGGEVFAQTIKMLLKPLLMVQSKTRFIHHHPLRISRRIFARFSDKSSANSKKWRCA